MRKKIDQNIKLFLKFLSISDKIQRQSLLRTITDNQLQLLVEIIFNLIKGVLPVSTKTKRLLYLNKDNIRKVVEESIKKSVRKKRLIKINSDLPVIVQSFLKYESRVGSDTKT